MRETLLSILSALDLTEADGKLILGGLLFFVVLYKFLQYKVFAPILAHVELREGATKGASETASLLREKAQALQDRYDEALFKARVEGNTARTSIISTAKAEASKIAAKAESEIAEAMKQGRAAIENQLKAARTKAEQDSASLADLLAQKVDSELSVH